MRSFFSPRLFAYNSIGISLLCGVSSLIVLNNLEEAARSDGSTTEQIRQEMLLYLRRSVIGIVIGGLTLIADKLMNEHEQNRLRR